MHFSCLATGLFLTRTTKSHEIGTVTLASPPRDGCRMWVSLELR